MTTDKHNTEDLPQDVNTCHEMIFVMSDSIRELSSERELLKKREEELLAKIQHLLLGNRREKYIDPNQHLLNFSDDPELQASLDAAKREAEQEVEQITYQRKKRREAKPRSESFPAHFPRVEIKIEIPTDKQQLIDAGQLILKGYEARETLSYEPAKLFVKRYLEPVFAAPEAPQKEVARIEAPDALGDKNRYDASIAAAIVHGKFGLHLPYYRLQEMFAASGWTPSRSTLDNLPNFVDEAVEELPRLMARRLLDSQCVGMDDTGVTLIMPAQIPEVKGDCSRTKRLIEKMLEAKQKGEKSLSAKMWAYSGLEDAPYDVFDFRVSRHRDGPAEFLAGYQGHVMADCYSGNLSVVLGSGGSMIRMACWAHARRHVFEAREVDHSISALPLAWIGQLYDIERQAVDKSVEERAELRQRQSQPILERMDQWLRGSLANSVLPASKLGQAFNYLRNHWEALQVYATDGRLPIDNNPVERLMKRVAVGKKNWLFVGSLRAGIRNANLMTLVASAHRHDLDVFEYLRDVIEHLNRGTARPSELLPDVWKQHHPEAVRVYRQEERRDKAESARLRAATRRLTTLP
jgi:transposase